MKRQLNFDTFTDIVSFLDEMRADPNLVLEEDVTDLVDVVCDSPLFHLIEQRVFARVGDPRDLFVKSLAELRSTGDIDCLVRHLSWQQSDIANLLCEIKDYNRLFKKLDEYRVRSARLQDSITKLRERNAELVRAIKNFNISTYGTKKSKNKGR